MPKAQAVGDCVYGMILWGPLPRARGEVDVAAWIPSTGLGRMAYPIAMQTMGDMMRQSNTSDGALLDGMGLKNNAAADLGS